MRELRVGDHVTTAYLDLAEPLLARQLDLQARYFFRSALKVRSALQVSSSHASSTSRPATSSGQPLSYDFG